MKFRRANRKGQFRFRAQKAGLQMWCGLGGVDNYRSHKDYGCESDDGAVITGGLFEADCDAAELFKF